MNKYVVNVLGNFGVSFFSPLVAGNIADSLFDLGVELDKILVISAVSALFITMLSVSKEASEWKKSK